MDELTFDVDGIRGLSIRAAYAKLKVLSKYDPHGADEDIGWVLLAAEQMGRTEYADGQCRLPIMFEDEPALKVAWLDGQRGRMVEQDCANCSGCNNDSGNPCPTHDFYPYY